MGYVLLASALVMLASLVGVISIWRHLGPTIERNISVLVSFSAGVFLLVGYELANETLEHSPSTGYGLLWIAVGILMTWIIFRFVPAFHHHHDNREESAHHSHVDGRRVLFSDALHNVGDGIVLAAAFTMSVPFGIITTFSIFTHELVQEISEFFVLRQAGYDTKQALLYNFLVSATILIGAFGGFFLLDTFERLEVPLLGLTAGALFVVLTFDLIPHSVRSSQKTTNFGKHFLWFTLGVLLMFGLNAFADHAHEANVHDDALPSETEAPEHGR